MFVLLFDHPYFKLNIYFDFEVKIYEVFFLVFVENKSFFMGLIGCCFFNLKCNVNWSIIRKVHVIATLSIKKIKEE